MDENNVVSEINDVIDTAATVTDNLPVAVPTENSTVRNNGDVKFWLGAGAGIMAWKFVLEPGFHKAKDWWLKRRAAKAKPAEKPDEEKTEEKKEENTEEKPEEKETK